MLSHRHQQLVIEPDLVADQLDPAVPVAGPIERKLALAPPNRVYLSDDTALSLTCETQSINRRDRR
jgi:hypothetical protein